jgi:glycosyltransferase involved in cell wall biosynthesis
MTDKLPPVAPVPPVLILGDHFGYPGGVMHGVTTYYLHVIPALAASGVDVHAAFLREPHPAAEALRERGIEPVFLDAGKWDPFVAFKVAAIIRKHGCRIVHACGMKAGIVARMASRMAGSKAIVHVHDLLYPSTAVGWMHQAFARSSDFGIGVSQAVREVVIKGYRVQPAHARVILNGIPLEHVRKVPSTARAQVRATLGIPEQAGVMAMIARMHPIKGHRSMLRIMSRIVAEKPDSVLLLAGDGPERAACEAMTDELGLRKQVRFLGLRKDVPELLAASDVAVIPSDSEGLPTVAIEASAAARTTVGFDAGGLRDIVADGVSGRLIAPGDEAGFAAAIVDLFSDRDKLHQYGQRALANSDRFTVESHIRELVNCYREVVATSPSGVVVPASPAG